MQTMQETFDTVAIHLLTQNAKSLCIGTDGLTEICAYRGHNNCKCAAGKLIPDEKYNEELEGNTVTHSTVIGLFTNYDLSLVHQLQYIHDNYNVDAWPMRLLDLGNKFRLDISKVLNFKREENVFQRN